jgi:hypothetical protein
MWVNRSFLYALCLVSTGSFAQIGGKHSYEFLNVPGNARLAALGGVNVSLADHDINFFHSNPALVGDSLSGWGSASYQFYVADIGQSTFSYSARFKKIGIIQFGIRHIDYGTIQAYDPSGAELGEFRSGETAVVIGKSQQVGNFRMGMNLRGIFSNLAGFHSSALMIDAGGVFIHPHQDFTLGLVIKNLGFVLSEYSSSSTTTLPFDVQLGTTFKPEYMPVRFSLTIYNLVENSDPYYDPSAGNEKPGTLDKVLRHLNFGAELLLHRNVSVLLGYNFQVHKTLKLEEAGGGAGVTVGINGRIKTFEFTISRSSYIAGAGAYAITLASDINKMLKRRQTL